MRAFKCCWVLSFLAVLATSTVRGDLEAEVEEFLEMIPYEQVMNLGMEYAMTDPQVKSFVQYISGHRFKGHITSLQESDQFNSIAERLAEYDFNFKALAKRINAAMGLRTWHEKMMLAEADKKSSSRPRRTPGDGMVGFVKEVVEITPFSEMKEAYKYKLSHNPQFKMVMERLLSGEAKRYFHEIEKSKPFQDMKKDLGDMGLHLNEICELFEKKLHDFFDIETTSRPTYVLTR